MTNELNKYSLIRERQYIELYRDMHGKTPTLSMTQYFLYSSAKRQAEMLNELHPDNNKCVS